MGRLTNAGNHWINEFVKCKSFTWWSVWGIMRWQLNFTLEIKIGFMKDTFV